MTMIVMRRGLIVAAAAAAVVVTAAPADAGPPGPDQSPNVSVTIGDLPSDGSVPRLPSRDVGKVKKEQAGRTAAAVVAELPAYQRDGYTPHKLQGAAIPSWGKSAPLIDSGLHDAQGVRMFSFNGRTWNHPVFQGAWGLSNVTSYLNTGNRLYLDRAIANAQRNLDRKVVSRGAWWYPYDFDLSRCVKTLQAPWYSGMAQGRLLSLFVRLWEITGDAKWREAADNTFTSLTLGPDPAGPWATWVDEAGYLWLDEYPETPGTRGERVMNGHIAAMYGLYDYWLATGDQRAADLFDGAATAVRRYLPNPIRNLRWASNYSLGCLAPHVTYHVIHTAQALKLYEVTWAPVFAMDAYLLRSDYPAPTVAGNVRFSAGTHTGYKFSSTGTITGSKRLAFPRASLAPANQRIRVYGRSYYYRITAGAFAGYMVLETAGARELLGKAVEHAYNPARVLRFQPGTYTAYAYNTAGTVTATKRLTFATSTSAPLGSTAWVNGKLSYRVIAGAFKGYWLPHTTGLAFR